MKVSLKLNPLKCSAKTSDVINVINVGTHESNAWVHVCKNVSIVHSLWVWSSAASHWSPT